MKKILITGASGNIGYEIIRGLKEIGSNLSIIAGDFKVGNAKEVLQRFDGLNFRKLDFSNSDTYKDALEGIDIVFLLRPPHLADVPKFFAPFIAAMKENNISKVVFLSVQGVENQKFIPHYKLEKLILEHELEYAFLRPAYFMQNLTSTLIHEIKTESRIYIPAGKLKFNWVDARDIGLIGAHILNDFENFKNQAFEITGSEFENLGSVAKLLSDNLDREIKYKSPSLLSFYLHKRKLGMARPMILVMIMLHFLPRFGKNKERLTSTVKDISGKEPGRLQDFITREVSKFHR